MFADKQIDFSLLTLEEIKLGLQKDEARRWHQTVVTRAKNAINAEIKRIRSDRTIKKLDKMILIRDLQREKANL